MVDSDVFRKELIDTLLIESALAAAGKMPTTYGATDSSPVRVWMFALSTEGRDLIA